MNKFSEHFRNTILGYFIGIPLLELIQPYPSYIISGIQCVFFAGFYACIDRFFRSRKKKISAVV